MLTFPQRHEFAGRADFVAVATEALNSLIQQYEQLPVETEPPLWACQKGNPNVFHIALPLEAYEKRPTVSYGALNSLMNHMIEMKKSIKQMARVHKDGLWCIFVEVE